MNQLDKLLLLMFPFMDVGIVMFGVPLRLGELAFLLFFLRMIDITSVLRVSRIHLNGFLIILLLLLNLLLVIVVTTFSDVDDSYYIKYIIRNGLYFFAMISFIIRPIKIENINFEKFIRYILYVVSIFYLMEFLDYYVVSLNWDSVFVARQEKNVFRDIIIRFAGPSSEGGHLIPLLSIPLMYGLIKKKNGLALLSIVLMLLTFSSFGYAVIVFAIFFLLRSSANKELIKRVKGILVNGLVLALFIGVVFAEKVATLIAYNWTKIQAYFRVGGATEWSASQRTNHIKLAFDLFLDSPWHRMLFGNGSGYYSKMSKEFTKYYLDEASEAHSLYFSTLTDRGVFGLILLIILFFTISQIKIPKNAQGDYKHFFLAIKFGVLVKIFHWTLTGMLWQYYFWVEIALLISVSTYYIKVLNERR